MRGQIQKFGLCQTSHKDSGQHVQLLNCPQKLQLKNQISFQEYQFQDVSVLLVIITPIKTYFVIMFPIISMFPILSMTAEWL